jgi:hypothetical protein
LLSWLKSRFVTAAIYYAALKTIFSAPDIPAAIAVGSEGRTTDVTNLSVVINPHFTGNLSYDFTSTPGATTGISLRGHGGAERLDARFVGPREIPRPAEDAKLMAWRSSRPACPTAPEMDGKSAQPNIRIQLLQGYLKVCQ